MQASSSARRWARWPDTQAARRLGVRYPIIQGPFGGGSSTVQLTATVSNAGALGSFGAYGLPADEIAAVVGQIRELTTSSFAVNLWVSTHDVPEQEITRARFDAAVEQLRPVYNVCGVAPPPYPQRFAPEFAEQIDALLRARPPVFSFVFGVPDEHVFEACREAGIATIGTASSVEEAVALDEAGADLIVASGFEAGGHRVSFLAPAEESLTGGLALIPAVADHVKAPVIAAGGIADARGILAALDLGAQGVQIGTAFLATDESGASTEHREALFDAPATELTRALTGRLARGIPNTLLGLLAAAGQDTLPFPYQAYLLKPIFATAEIHDRLEMAKLWSGQATGLLTHRRAADLVGALVADTEDLLTQSPRHEAQAGQAALVSSLERWANEGGCLGPDPREYTTTDDTQHSRFEIRAAGKPAGSLAYQRRCGLIALEHTEVRPEFQGRGVAGKLIQAALQSARERELIVLPLCRYVSGYIAKHDEYLDLVPGAQREDFDLPAGT